MLRGGGDVVGIGRSEGRGVISGLWVQKVTRAHLHPSSFRSELHVANERSTAMSGHRLTSGGGKRRGGVEARLFGDREM